MRPKSQRKHKPLKSRKNKNKNKNKKVRTSAKRFKGGFSELGFFLQKGLSIFDMTPSTPYGNPGVLAPFPYFQSK